MTIERFSEVALARNLPQHGLGRGNLATVVEHLPATPESGGEPGYALEVFNALGESIRVVSVPCSAVEPLRASEVPAIRPLGETG